MLDLALALIGTPLGLAALAALAAAAAAAAWLPRAALPLACAAALLAGAAYVASLQADLDDARRERDAARADAAGKAAAIEAMQAEAAESAARAKSSASAHARIRRAPAAADGPVALVLRDALEGLR